MTLHTGSALALLLLWIFAIFWHLAPLCDHDQRVVQGCEFYAYGIFKGERHPYRKAYWRKHNPLQALSYLALKLFLFPAIWISGILYLTYDFWEAAAADWALTWVAKIHAAVAFAILIFVIIHFYLLTTGHSFKEHVMPMINGFDDVDLTPEEDYLEKDEPGHIR